jgi:transcriptional regulator with XRE-family HTH domain
MKERIIEFLKAENKSSAQLAEEIGVQPSGISHILSGRNNPSLDFVLKMLDKYKFLSSDWLLFGKGSMYREAQMQKLFDDSEVTQPELNNRNEKNLEKIVQNDEAKEESSDIEISSECRISRVVMFYSDGTSSDYIPGNNH